MPASHKKRVTHRLVQAAKANRVRCGAHLARIGLHPGQDSVLKSLSEEDGQTMSELALTLAVQPPTVTKMITRLAAHGYVVRQASDRDGRLARVFLTDEGRALVKDIDKLWKKLEKEALAGIDEKDRKKLRKLLRMVERNLAGANGRHEREDADEDDADEILPEPA
jgi:DNA-binding MarR family transcriptional regulator